MSSRLLFLALAFGALAQAAAPAVFYTDLDSGPNTGGENNNGAYVTVYGKRFGALQGTSTVTFGGGEVAAYKLWSDTKVVVQLGPAASTGPVVVNVGSVASNNTVTFTVRSGNIYFASTTGADSNDGSYATPFASITKCKNKLAPGDICYIEDAYMFSGADTYNTNLYLGTSGTAGNPKALLAYPGASVTLGNNGQAESVYFNSDYWTIAGLNLRNPAGVVMKGRYNRVVGNNFQCPTGDGASACAESSQAIHLKFYGNEISAAGCGENSTWGALPCAWTHPSTTIATAGTAMTIAAFTSGFTAPDRIYAERDGSAVMKKVVSCSDSTHCTLDSAFSPDLPAGSSWYFRDFAPNKQYHSLYFSSDSSDIDAGWNYIHDNLSCRGIQFHSSPLIHPNVTAATNASPIMITVDANTMLTPQQRVSISGVTGNAAANGTWFVSPIDNRNFALYSDFSLTSPVTGNGDYAGGGIVFDGNNQHTLSVHDNYILGQTCDGINFATVDPSIGPVQVYNNVIANVGRGVTDGDSTARDPVGGEADYSAIFSGGGANHGPTGSGTVEVYNNTIYDSGAIQRVESGAFNAYANATGMTMSVTNNIIYQSGSEHYLTSDCVAHGSCQTIIVGGHNLWYGAGAPPLGFNADLASDPNLLNTGLLDFHLLGPSPAIGTGTSSAALTDMDGVVRRSPPTIGAFEAAAPAGRHRITRGVAVNVGKQY